MASRVGLTAILTLVAMSCLAGSARSEPPVGTSVYAMRVDPRLCPSPLCGGYWVALANGARTRCADGTTRPRCYVAKAVDERRHPLELSVPDGALARATIEASDYGGLGRLGVLAVAAVYAPAGSASASGGYYRVSDTGLRCVRAPCFSYRATQVNGRTRTPVSGIDLGATKASPVDVVRAEAALRTKSGLLARGRFDKSADGGRVFRALRLYLRAPQPRA
jgi:hypothetical protein